MPGLDSPEVQEEIKKLEAERERRKAEILAACKEEPITIAGQTFYPINSQLTMGLTQPHLMRVSQVTYRILILYFMTIEPKRRMVIALEGVQCVADAADWWEGVVDKIEGEDAEKILALGDAVFDRIVEGGGFFFPKESPSPTKFSKSTGSRKGTVGRSKRSKA